jgi:hypothetical protein
VLAGKKQSGKNTLANFVTGYTITQLARRGEPYLPTRFTIDEETGELIISPPIDPALTEQPVGEHILNLYDQDPEVTTWLYDCVHPRVKVYSFADKLKEAVSVIFGVPISLLYGTDEDKRQFTNVKWKDMCALIPAKKAAEIKRGERYEQNMTVRELLQYFGTNICRKLYGECWVDACFRSIEVEQPEIAIIADCRFRNEVMASKKRKAKIVRLERSPYKDLHDSEVDLDKMQKNNFNLVIGKDVTIREQNQLLLDAMYEWGWFENHLDLEA